jgi:hypothetical protein
MDTKELEKYRATLTSERDAKIFEITSRYKKKLDALAVLIDDQEQIPLPIATPEVVKIIRKDVTNVFRATREAIEDGGLPVFSSKTLFAFISQKYPGQFAKKPTDLSGCLWRLRKGGEIEIVTQGIGHVASMYKKTDKYGKPQ